MPSLKLKSGTPVEVEKGKVCIEGGCVVLYELRKDFSTSLVIAHQLQPGETVRRTGEDDYIVEY
jgi:hypothetical protein